MTLNPRIHYAMLTNDWKLSVIVASLTVHLARVLIVFIANGNLHNHMKHIYFL